MNITQTQQLLSFLWSKFPNSRNLTTEDKRSTVIAYFDELWQLSLHDALEGAREAMKIQPHFIPSAPEIAFYSHKTFNIDHFLTSEYHDVNNKIADARKSLEVDHDEYKKAFEARNALSQKKFTYQFSKSEIENDDSWTKIIDGYYDKIDECRRLEHKRDGLYAQACWMAEQAYNSAERALASNDLKQLSFATPNFALDG